MNYRRVPTVDELYADDEALILTDVRAVRVSGIGPKLLAILSDQWQSESALVAGMEELFGSPDTGSAKDLVVGALTQLLDQGLVESDDPVDGIAPAT